MYIASVCERFYHIQSEAEMSNLRKKSSDEIGCF